MLDEILDFLSNDLFYGPFFVLAKSIWQWAMGICTGLLTTTPERFSSSAWDFTTQTLYPWALGIGITLTNIFLLIGICRIASNLKENITLELFVELMIRVVALNVALQLGLNNAVLTFRKFGGIVTMAMQNVTAALANPLLVELFSNCAYKCFLDQGGVDAKSLAQIQELSEKEYRALGSGKEGQGVMVWNKKVVLFDAKIRKDNVLYETFSTNYHEKAEQQSRSGKKMEEQGKEILEGAEEQNDPEGMYESTVLRLAALSAVSVQDITEILSISREESRQLLTRMTETGQLVEIASDQEERYKKAV